MEGKIKKLRSKIIFGIIFLGGLGACTSLHKTHEPSPDQQRAWRDLYQSALESAKSPSSLGKACSNLNQLSLDQQFPLQNLVSLRQILWCDGSEMPTLSDYEKKWYEELVGQAQLKLAEKTTDLHDDITALLSLAKSESNYKKKEDYLLRTLALAKSTQDPEAIANVEQSLYRSSPRRDPNWKNLDPFVVAQNYRLWREFPKAEAIYRQIHANTKNSFEKRYNALKQLSLSIKSQQRRDDYVIYSGKLSQWCEKEKRKMPKDLQVQRLCMDAKLSWARALWTENQVELAKKKLFEVIQEQNGKLNIDETLWIIGRIFEEQKNYIKSQDYFRQSLQENKANTSLRSKILWNLAWIEYKSQRYQAATEHFQQMYDQVTEPGDRAKSLFWLARSQRQLGLDQVYKTTLNQLLSEDPLGYYGYLAHSELGITPTKLNISAESPRPLRGLVADDLEYKIYWLGEIKERSFGEKALNLVQENLRPSMSADNWLKIYMAYAKMGLYLPLFASINQQTPLVKAQVLEKHPNLLFPMDFEKEVLAASAKTGTPPELIFSIMRQESAFNPLVRSNAEAFGLLQLLPSVAKPHTQKMGITLRDPSDLFLPEMNIPLGAAELKRLLDHHRNNYVLAIANYNANENSIRKWLQTRYREDQTEFIEEIPFEETRTYVKLVLRNMFFYKRIQKVPGS